MKEKVSIIIDDRELKSKVGRFLFELGAELEPKRLEQGDFILSKKVIVERKRVRDFVDSIVDGRLLSQAVKLKNNYESPIFILEGKENIYTQRKMHPNSIRGMISSLALDFKIPIIRSIDEEDSAGIIFQIAKREQIKETPNIEIHAKKPLSRKEKKEFIIASLPYIGTKLAKKLLEKFGSVKKVINADIKELKSIEGIGDKKSEEIIKLIEDEYEKDN